MARNAVQFPKGLSEPEFERQYGTEAACHEASSDGTGRTASSVPPAANGATAR